MKYTALSPIFLALSTGFVFCSFMLTYYPALIWFFLFILCGWIISLSLHEFGHAAVAYYFGDKSVAEKGYLSLNPLKYTHTLTSIIVPLLFIFMGGIGFPGGAVYINMAKIYMPKERSLVSAAGPIATSLFLLFLIIVNMLIPSEQFVWLSYGVSFLAFLQITVLFFNLLPIPGLDGFGIIKPFLKKETQEKIEKKAGLFILGILFLLFIDSPVNKLFWTTNFTVTRLFGFNLEHVIAGFRLFQFWN